MELVKLLRMVEMFAGLDSSQLAEVASIFKTHELEAGDVLFSQGDTASDLYIVQEGFVEVIREHEDDLKTKVIVNLGPGQSVGEMGLIDQGSRSATIKAVEKAVVVSVSREEFFNFCDVNCDIGYWIMRNIAADLSFRLRRK